jgi:flagellum-specific ATP synthase
VTDAAIAAREPIDSFLRQKPDEVTSADEADSMLTQLALLSGVPEPVPAQPIEPAPQPPQAAGTPLHSAIPPLHLAA